MTDKGEIAASFCDSFTEVGPRLAAGVRREREGAFLEYLGDRVGGSLFMRPTTPQEVKKICRQLIPYKSMGWDEISPRVIRIVALEIFPSLSRLFNLLPGILQDRTGGASL